MFYVWVGVYVGLFWFVCLFVVVVGLPLFFDGFDCLLWLGVLY